MKTTLLTSIFISGFCFLLLCTGVACAQSGNAVTRIGGENATGTTVQTTADSEKLVQGSMNEEELTVALQSAADLFNKADFDGALKRLEELCKSEPKLAPPRIILAQWFARAQLPNAIMVSLEAATTEHPDDPEAFLLLGEISLKKSEVAAAKLFFDHADQLLKKYNLNADRKKLLEISLLRNRASLAETRRDWKLSENLIDARIALEGKTSELLRQKAISLFQQEQFDGCLTLLKEADILDTAKENKGLPAEALISQLYILKGDAENGKSFLDRALEKYPNSKDILALAVVMRLSDEDLEGARKLAEKLVEEDKGSIPGRRLLATIALYQEDYTNAEKIFQELIVASPSDAASANGLALALCEQNDQEKLQRALEYALENVRKDSKNSEYLGTLGWVLYKAKQTEQAAKVLQEAAANGNVNSQTAYFIARIAFQNGHIEQAKQLLQAALKNNQPFAKRKEAKNLLTELSR